MKFNLSKIKFSKSDINRCLKLPKNMTPELAEEIGLHIGDGSMNFYLGHGIYQLRGHIKDDKAHYLNRIAYLYKKLFNLDVSIRNMPSTGVIGFQIWSDALVSFKSSILGLSLGKKLDFPIPEYLKEKELFFSFIRGLFDTDGTFYIENKRGKPYPRIEIKIICAQLSKDITELLNKYGIRATLYRYKRKEENWNDLYSISVRGFSQLQKWFNLIGSNNPKHKEKYCLVGTSDGPAEI